MRDNMEDLVQLFPDYQQAQVRSLTRQLAETLTAVDMAKYAELKLLLDAARAEQVDWDNPPVGYEHVRAKFNERIAEANTTLPNHLKFEPL